ncbi:Hsp20/alpha crystallin family protein [Streptomyces fungicidicus]|uniref:Hsp20/alpha crystallin family protein n=1 Tax=Streptomyces fungicidicus TaxID=68203 RepID=UPI0037A0AC50
MSRSPTTPSTSRSNSPASRARTSTSKRTARSWWSPERSRRKNAKASCARSTRRTGAFEYRLRLPGEVDTEKIDARMSDGVLAITVPKAAVAKPRHVEISETSDSAGSSG